MFVFLSKFLPILIYPVGIASILLLITLFIKKDSKWQRVLVVIALVVIWVGGNRWVAVGLIHSLEWRYLPLEHVPSSEVIVVLGGGTDPKQYPRQIVELNSAGDRVLYGAWLYHQGIAPHILLSGGYIPWMGTRTSPAEEMATILNMLDVPEDAIWLEPKSQNTYENAVYSKEILENKDIHRIVLVTSAIHMPRSVALFKHQGLEVIPAPTDYFVTESLWNDLFPPSLNAILFNLVPSADNLGKTTLAIKEYIGILIYHLRGWM
ncbi:MAG TPA: YdcF family protein [Anaerolineae bacterium]|nr:YdcF family protein [Anaerolineae bacterium]